MTIVLDPAEVARRFRDEIRRDVAALPGPLKLRGILATDHGPPRPTGEARRSPSQTYAEYTRRACEEVGVAFELLSVHRLEAEAAIQQANADPTVHGIFVYYPIFGTGQDSYLRDLVDPAKDVEGLHQFWARCLYENRRFLDEERTRKAILPCTPLAILKLLDAAGASRPGAARPLAGKRACIFNRSEVIGRPLAAMMANDGAEVISFDVDGPLRFSPAPAEGAHEVHETGITRAEALARADIVITGVPVASFPLVRAGEIAPGAICINFSTLKNFADDVHERAAVFVPRVGPMTVTMALRNTLRLHANASLVAARAG